MTILAIYFYVLTVVAIFFMSEKKPHELVAVVASVIRGQSSKSTSRRS